MSNIASPAVPSLAEAVELAEQASGLSVAVAQTAQALSKVSVPPPALVKLQADYVSESTALWNRLLGSTPATDAAGKAGSNGKAGDRRFSSEDWFKSPATAYLAEMYLLNARTLLQ